MGLKACLPRNNEPTGTVSNLISGANYLLQINLHNRKTVLVPFQSPANPHIV
jgi:ribosomal 30S subunit maturation factor RimM